MKISAKKREKISEQILGVLYANSPRLLFTSQIAVEIARDEEFVKSILEDLNKKNLIIGVKKNPLGRDYVKRCRWKLSEKAYEFYKNHQ